uniref:Palladin n=1 Tax=Pygocentrus nattereri TaxID=42514 RepID=A0AAR2JRV9_PYGNA
MQDRSWNDTLPLSVLLKERRPPGAASLEGDGGVFSEASSDGEVYLDSLVEFEAGDGDFPELSAFLSQDEINRSLDLAREAMSDTSDPCDLTEPPVHATLPKARDQDLCFPSSSINPPPQPPTATEHQPVHPETKGTMLPVPVVTPTSSSAEVASVKVTSSQSVQLSRPTQACAVPGSPASPDKFVCHKSVMPMYKQERPRLVHGGLEVNERAASATEFCTRAATFIEELSSIFKGSRSLERQGEEDSSSPDSGYLSPRSHRLAAQQAQSSSSSSSFSSGLQQEAALRGQAGMDSSIAGSEHQGGGVSVDGPMAPPRFTQKLKSQEVAEGSPIRLECRVIGNPQPLVRWFCEGRELHHCPDIQICRDGDLHTLVIAEAFEDDTGRYTCVASNSLGADNTSAEVYIEVYLSMVQKKTASVSLTICSSSPKSPEKPSHRSTLLQPLSAPPQRLLQDAQASEGQVVVLECRVKGSPPVQVQWFRQGQEIQDSPDFRILQKKPRSAAEPEEICTLVIAEAFPEDGGLFCCTATNQYGSVNCTAQLTVTPGVFKCTNSYKVSQLYHHSTTMCSTKQKYWEYCHNTTSSDTIEIFIFLHDQVLLEQQEVAKCQQQQQQLEQEAPPPSQQEPQEGPPPSPPLPPPPSFQELERSTMQTSTFNYARPKQFIAAQSPSSGGPVGYSTRVSLPPFQPQPKGGSLESPVSPSFPPPPPPFYSSSNVSSPSGPPQDFPPPPPPPPPPVSASPTRSDSSSPFTSVPPSPAGFLVSVLPATPSTPPVNALGLPKGNGTVGFPRKTGRTPRIVSDSEIQGSKDAVIQDLERKLRFKEERLSNGQQRLTYEEKMARRLLGADSAATVFNTQQTEEEPATQEYKVSSFEQRLISEIEFRLERSPVEESDDDVQHDEDATGECVAPFFDQKLKHYKVFEGMPVTFSCKVIGDPKPKVYWFKDGKQISKRSEHYRISRDPDGTCSLHTAASSLDDDGNYTIMAGNPAGRVSCTGRMMVQAVNQRGRSQRSTPGHIRRSRDSGEENENIQERHFRPHFLQAPGDLIVQEGKLCRMDCKVSGLPTPDLIWQLNGQTIRPDSAHKMLVRENGIHSLVIEPVTSRDAGVYTCIASNRAGQNSFSLELIVAAKEMHKTPTFIEKLQNTGVAEGYPVRLECRVAGVPFPQIFWKKENESFTHNTDRISMHQDNFGYLCMIIQPALKEDAGWYTVSAKNEAGIVSSTARLDVHTQWQQPNTPKPKKVRPSTSRYAALTERGLDVKAAFFPDSSPLPPGTLVESDDL